MDSKYKNPDNDIMPWTSDNPCAPGAKSHQGMVYAIQHPFTGELLYPATSSCWRYEQQTMLDYMQGWCAYELKSLNDAEKRAEICGIDVKDIRQDVKGNRVETRFGTVASRSGKSTIARTMASILFLQKMGMAVSEERRIWTMLMEEW